MTEEKSTKLGLALSGGGFRASFYHIGVLARMADLGLLRHVDVISTVSGGSIVGALYYLHVKKLLEEKEDSSIKDVDYQDIIGKIEVDFLQVVQRNLRLRTFLNPLKNLKMSLANYSRSDYIGELYDKFLYRHVLDPDNTEPIKMKDLKIIPFGEGPSFDPSEGNKTRKAKVPVLLMNATVLNDGHNWRFSAENMGESNELDEIIDKNFRLKKAESYENLYKYGDFKLGLAVAASSCVPGVFAPLAISDLYDEGIRVQLVDGGTHDNQGIVGLLDKTLKCTHFIISDASAQMEDEKEPGVHVPNVLKRTSSILFDRIREQQLTRIKKEHSQNVAFLHLRKGLPVKEIAYYDKYHKLQNKTVLCEAEPSCQAFGVNEDVQNLLSRFRTDLDSFSEVEAFSLMLDGYKMSEFEINKTNINQFVTNTSLRVKKYQFFKIERWISSPIVAPIYKRHLEAGSKPLFRAVRLSRSLKIVITLVFAFIFEALFANYSDGFIQWTKEPIKKGNILLLLLLIIIVLGFYLSRYVSYRNRIAQFWLSGLPTALASLIGAVFIWIHLLTFDRLFLYLGRLEVLERAQKKSKVDLMLDRLGNKSTPAYASKPISFSQNQFKEEFAMDPNILTHIIKEGVKSKGIDTIEKLFAGKGKEEIAEELTALRTRVEDVLSQLDTSGQFKMNSSNDQSQQNMNSSFNQNQQNMNSSIDPSQQNMNSSIDPSQQNMNSPIDPSQQNMNSSIDPSQQNMNSPIDPSQQNMNSSIDPSQQNMNSPINPSQQNMNSSIDPSQQNMNSSIDPSQQNMNSPIDPSQQNMNSSIDPSQQNMNSPIDPSQQNMNSSFDPSQQNMNSSFDPSEYNMNSPIDPSQQNMNSPIDPSQQNMNSSFDSSEYNMNSSFDPSQENMNSSMNPSEYNMNSSFDPSQENMNSSMNPSEYNMNSSMNPSEYNMNSSFDPSEYNMDSSFDPSQENMNSSFDPSEYNMNSAFDRSQENMNSSMNPSEYNMNSSFDQTQPNELFEQMQDVIIRAKLQKSRTIVQLQETVHDIVEMLVDVEQMVHQTAQMLDNMEHALQSINTLNHITHQINESQQMLQPYPPMQ